LSSGGGLVGLRLRAQNRAEPYDFADDDGRWSVVISVLSSFLNARGPQALPEEIS
jgi:hypothetical protein